ncbi:MAG: diacylglycerol/lipid kinase family protein [Bacteroidia bacterium]
MKQNKKLLFVINPAAGGKDKSQLPLEIETFCTANEIVHVILETSKRATARKIKDEIDRFHPDCVVAAGGDGTVNLVGKLLINNEIALGIIPLGSSNAVAKNLKIPLDLQQALENIHHFNIKKIDTLNINEHICLHLCDLGFNANLIKRAHKSKFRGMFTYAISLFQELFTFSFFRYKVITQSDEIEGKAFAITITNMQLYGSRAVINPKGKVDDGKFEICIFKPFPKIAMIKMFYQLFRHTIHYSKYSIFIRAKEATLYNQGKESVHIDGEPVELNRKIDIKIVPKSLKVVVPG